MTVDDVAKLLIVSALSLSIVGLTYQTMRLIGSLADSIKDLRKVLQVAGDLSERLALDYDFISSRVKNTVDSVSGFASNILDPLSTIFGFMKGFKKKKKEEVDDFEDLEEEDSDEKSD